MSKDQTAAMYPGRFSVNANVRGIRQCMACLIALLATMPACEKTKTVDPSSSPAAPSQLSGQALSATSISLQWHDNSANENNFLIYRGHLGGWNELCILDADRVSYIDSTVTDSSAYSYYIIARNSSGDSGPSNTITISTAGQNYPPLEPSYPSPPDNSINFDVDIALIWYCEDPDGDSLTYDIYFGPDGFLPLADSGLTELQYRPGLLNRGTEYNWKVVAHDGRGNSTSGPAWRFTTFANHAPRTPDNPSPGDTSSNVPINTALSWQCNDPDGDTLTYDIYFGQDPIPPRVAVGIGDTSYSPGQMAFSTTYYWKVAARDNFGRETIGPLWAFITSDSEYTITTLVQGFGSISKLPDYPLYNFGDMVIITATPGAGWRFWRWTGDYSGPENPLTVVIDRDLALTGVFTMNGTSAVISGAITWPGHVLSSYAYAFADSMANSRLCLVAQATVNPSNGAYTMRINDITSAIQIKFEGQDDVNNSGPWNPVDLGDGWGFYDADDDGLWNDFITISPGDSLTGVDIRLSDYVPKR